MGKADKNFSPSTYYQLVVFFLAGLWLFQISGINTLFHQAHDEPDLFHGENHYQLIVDHLDTTSRHKEVSPSPIGDERHSSSQPSPNNEHSHSCHHSQCAPYLTVQSSPSINTGSGVLTTRTSAYEVATDGCYNLLFRPPRIS